MWDTADRGILEEDLAGGSAPAHAEHSERMIENI
jgi:hypothetical protein